MRIVSLVPSLTHMVCDFGLRDAIVGCTSFCVEPPGLAKVVKVVGGTKDPDLEAIKALEPTHVLVNVEENKPEHIEALQALAPTLVTFPKKPADVPPMLREAGAFLGVAGKAEEHAIAVTEAVEALKKAGARGTKLRYIYLIWREPYMAVGTDTYIAGMLAAAGMRDAMDGQERYPTLTVEEMQRARPDVVFMSTEPYPFRARDAARLRSEWPGAPQILRIDGQALSWYGTMTAAAASALAHRRRSEAGVAPGERIELKDHAPVIREFREG
jgi:ABC-type hemin transport system substrate-binding protein